MAEGVIGDGAVGGAASPTLVAVDSIVSTISMVVFCVGSFSSLENDFCIRISTQLFWRKIEREDHTYQFLRM